MKQSQPASTSAPRPTLNTNPHPKSSVQHNLVRTLRMLLALLLAVVLAPITAPALFVRLPPCLPVRLLERLAVRAVSLIAAVAAVEVLLSARSDTADRHSARLGWLPGPLVRLWTSALARGRFVRTYDQPGRWMSDAQLDQLCATLRQVAVGSIGAVPTHRVFDGAHARAAFSNRVVSIAFDDDGPLGFTAMVYLDCGADVVLHLGLTMIGKRARGQRLQSALCTKCLLVLLVNLCRTSFNVTNCAASPAGIGNVAEYFLDCYPHYDDGNALKEHHLVIATRVLERYRYEFGCSEKARFDARTFVVRKSNERDGGGTHQFIKEDGTPVSQHYVKRCNEYVASVIDFAAGDELFQVATLNVFASVFKYVSSSWRRRRRY